MIKKTNENSIKVVPSGEFGKLVKEYDQLQIPTIYSSIKEIDKYHKAVKNCMSKVAFGVNNPSTKFVMERILERGVINSDIGSSGKQIFSIDE